MKILTILTYISSMLIYEIGICNINNFSLARIALYCILLVFLTKNIDKFIDNAKENFKYKKIILVIYGIISLIAIIFLTITWGTLYKILALIITVLMGMLLIIYISSDYIKNVILIISTLGILFTFNTNFHNCLDEKKHSMSAVNLALGNFNYIENGLCHQGFNSIKFNTDIDNWKQLYSEKFESELTEEWKETEEHEFYYECSSPADYNFILYIPSAIGINFARLLGGSIADAYIMGRMFNLLLYAAMVILTLKLLPYKRKIFFIIYMLPISILLAASYSVDGFCIGILGIFIAYCLHLKEDYEKVGLKQILILIMLFLLCLLAKNWAYFAIVLFALTMPIIKILKNNKKQLPIIVSAIAVIIIICIVILVLKLGNAVIEEAGDIRGGNDVNAAKQLEYLLSNPINIIKVVFEHIMNSLLSFDWYAQLNPYVFFGKYYKQIFLLEMIFLLYASITDNSPRVSNKITIISILTFFAVFITTSMMLYLQYTPVGNSLINGYQTRYILPILPLILMLLHKRQNGYKNNDFEISTISGTIVLINLICLIYKI